MGYIIAINEEFLLYGCFQSDEVIIAKSTEV